MSSKTPCPAFPNCPGLSELKEGMAHLEEKVEMLCEEVRRTREALFGNGLHEKSIIAKVNILWYSLVIGLGLLLGGGALKVLNVFMQ